MQLQIDFSCDALLCIALIDLRREDSAERGRNEILDVAGRESQTEFEERAARVAEFSIADCGFFSKQ
jgi:hypothetical protein